MAKINLPKITKEAAVTHAAILVGSALLAKALTRDGARQVANQIEKSGLKLVDEAGVEHKLTLKPWLQIP